MIDGGFVFEIEYAVTVWYDRFTSLSGRLLEGTVAVEEWVSLPLTDGTRKAVQIICLADGNRLVGTVSADPSREAKVGIQIWGSVRAETILVPGTATRSNKPNNEVVRKESRDRPRDYEKDDEDND